MYYPVVPLRQEDIKMKKIRIERYYAIADELGVSRTTIQRDIIQYMRNDLAKYGLKKRRILEEK